MTKQTQIQSVIDKLVAEVPDIRAAVVASRDGLAIAATTAGAEGNRVAATAATVHALGDRVSSTTDLGAIEETVIRGDELTFVVYDAGSPAVLAVTATGDCSLGMVHLEARIASARVAELLLLLRDEPAFAPPSAPTERAAMPISEIAAELARPASTVGAPVTPSPTPARPYIRSAPAPTGPAASNGAAPRHLEPRTRPSSS